MWFKLAGATFTNNLGTMDSISKSYLMDYSGLTGLQASPGSVSYVDENGNTISPNATITFTVKSGYVFKTDSTVTASGGATGTYKATADIAAGSTFTMALTAISDKVTFSGAAELVSGGSTDDGGSEGDATPPSDSTTYTFTINPTPSTATVTLNASGYTTVSGTGSKSITVASGTSVSWSVSADGYTTQSDTQTVTSTSSKSVTLSASSYPTSGTLPLVQNALSVVKGENFYQVGSTNNTRMSSSSITDATGIFVPSGKTLTLTGTSGLRFDYVYATKAGPNSNDKSVNTIGGVGTASNFVSSNYFPLNADGSSNTITITNSYGTDYYYFFAIAAPNKTSNILVANYQGTITWAIS